MVSFYYIKSVSYTHLIESLRRKSIMEKMIVVFKRQRQKPWASRIIISADKLHISWPPFSTIGGRAPPLSVRGADVVCWLVKAHVRLRFCPTNGQIGCIKILWVSAAKKEYLTIRNTDNYPCLLHRITNPVSYTHLDVYKRQLFAVFSTNHR